MCFDSLQIKIENDFSVLEISGSGVDEDPKGILQVDSNTGEITVHGPVDHEKYPFLKVRRKSLKQHCNQILYVRERKRLGGGEC